MGTIMNDTIVKSAAETALQACSDDALRSPCYCEENVWRLAHRKMHSSNNDNNKIHYYAVFVSNPEKCVPMFYQLAETNSKKACFWDYHVILISKGTAGEEGTLVHDMDSHLPYPCPLSKYLQRSFPDIDDTCPEEYAPMFRVVQAALFLKHFSSDRMHMFDSKTKTWSAPSPDYPCIQPTTENNLMTYNTMTVEDVLKNATVKEDNPFGVVYTLPQLLSRFSKPWPA